MVLPEEWQECRTPALLEEHHLARDRTTLDRQAIEICARRVSFATPRDFLPTGSGFGPDFVNRLAQDIDYLKAIAAATRWMEFMFSMVRTPC